MSLWIGICVLSITSVIIHQGLSSAASNKSPRFVEFESTFFEDESISIGHIIGLLQAVDEDDTQLTFAILGEIANSILYLERSGPKQMRIKLKKDLDRELIPQYEILFEVRDQVNVIHKSALLVVIDVNDNQPTFLHLPYSADVNEDVPVGLSIFTAEAEDHDSGVWGLVSYKIITQQGIFTIDSSTGVVSTLMPLDYESTKFYQLKIMAFDGDGLNSTTDLIVNVLDVQDSPPTFTGLPYLAAVWENASMGSSVITVQAMDGDRGAPNTLSYSLLPGSSDLFQIDSRTGTIRVSKAIDRENPAIRDLFGVLSLNVLVQEVVNFQHSASTATVTVTIRVLDVNDQSPTFSQAVYTARVLENGQQRMPLTMQPIGTEIVVKDYDENDSGRFEIVLLQNGRPFDLFDVVPSRALNEANILLRVKNSSALDYETVKSVTFQMVVREYLSVERHQSICEVTVIIDDDNDNWPHFKNSLFTATIPENSPHGTFVTRVMAFDADAGEFGRLTYQLHSTGVQLFSIDAASGDVYVAVAADSDSSLLDRERLAVHQVALVVVDGGGHRADAQLVVSLSDVNDHRPQMTRSHYEGYLRENDNHLERPLHVEATDDDLPPNSVIRYHIVSGTGQSNFSIDETTGAISVVKAVDYERLGGAGGGGGQLGLVVTATDSGSPPLNTSCSISINIQDMNDERPHFEQLLYSVELEENAAAGSEVVQVVAHDLDATSPNSDVRYRLQSGGGERFRVDPETGVVRVEWGVSLDRDVSGREHTLVIRATDRGMPPLSHLTTVTIDITDVNNKPPVYSAETFSTAVWENTTRGSDVGQYTAHDPDLNAQLTYTLLNDLTEGVNEGNTPILNVEYLKGLFAIHRGNGSVYVRSHLDREVVEKVTLTMHVEDLRAFYPAPQTATAKLSIILKDVNDNAPTFVPSNAYTSMVSEGSRPGSHVIQVSAVDLDKESQPIRYYIAHADSLNGAEFFEILPENRLRGVVTLRAPLDYERHHSLTFSLLAVDSGHPGLSGTASVLVQVGDVNDNAPRWELLAAEVEVDEGAGVGRSVVRVRAGDADSGALGAVTYSIRAGGGSSFVINSTTGVISTATRLDREHIAEYHLTIEARDNVAMPETEQRRTSGYMKIILRDVNDNVPRFEQTRYMAAVSEGTKVGTLVTSVRATDRDAGANGRLEYSLEHGNLSDLFELRRGVSHDAGLYVWRPLLGRAGTYCSAVRATDLGQTPLTNTTTLCVTIDDLNDHKPIIVRPLANKTLFIDENVDRGHFVTQILAEDGDTGLNGEVRYELMTQVSNSQDWRRFSIDRKTGVIVTRQHIDREEQAKFFLEVRAYDLGVPSYADRRVLLIVVRDVNDNLPEFDRSHDPPPHRLSVLEEQDDLYIANLDLASDPDTSNNSAVCYYIVGGSSAYYEHFRLNRTSAALYLVTRLDRERVNEVELVIKASDDCWSGQLEGLRGLQAWNYSDLSLMLLRVTVVDVNDNPPKFSKSHFVFGVTKDTQFGQSVWDLKGYSYDVDEGNNSVLTYHMVAPVVASEPLQSQLRQRGEREAFVVGEDDGLIKTNIYFQLNMNGYFEFQVSVNDSVAGRGDVASISVYLLSEDQRAKVVLRGDVDEVGIFRDLFAAFLTNITGALINVDKVQTHQDSSGKPDTRKTDMFIHAIDAKTGKVLDAHWLITLIDKNYVHLVQLFKTYNVIEIVPAVPRAATSRTEDDLHLGLILVAVLLGACLVIVSLSCLMCHCRYRRKLKAATAASFGSRESGVGAVDLPGTNLHTYTGFSTNSRSSGDRCDPLTE